MDELKFSEKDFAAVKEEMGPVMKEYLLILMEAVNALEASQKETAEKVENMRKEFVKEHYMAILTLRKSVTNWVNGIEKRLEALEKVDRFDSSLISTIGGMKSAQGRFRERIEVLEQVVEKLKWHQHEYLAYDGTIGSITACPSSQMGEPTNSDAALFPDPMADFPYPALCGTRGGRGEETGFPKNQPCPDCQKSCETADDLGMPRKCNMDLWTPAEVAIGKAMDEVEKAGADVRLTHAIILLGQARDKVALFVDGEDDKRTDGQCHKCPVEDAECRMCKNPEHPQKEPQPGETWLLEVKLDRAVSPGRKWPVVSYSTVPFSFTVNPADLKRMGE